ncbi:hypothetical protein [Myceligenerans indicum]|uniref:Uncharacterized protein n=1 Tax=Myceligenerans indicum TaxID=2593663 RepID=A0ABS1LR58_9MICO|nr:hypothetical protein [Myceligenerans indicum]MBL0888489.1 hypothetical protein [Myceligenerans indicum]
MPPPRPAGQADDHEAEPGRTIKRPVRDRHGRREPSAATRRTGPRKTTGPSRTTSQQWAIGPPETVPMTADEYHEAVQAWAALIALWWTTHPPEQDHET